MTPPPTSPQLASRRSVVAAAGAVGLTTALAACSGSDSESDTGSDTDNAGSSGGGAEGGSELAKTSDIPEGGGKVFQDQKVVVTQPSPGEFKAYSAVCTHSGCMVNEISDGAIVCPCHASRFSIADGSVTGGPAPAPLPGAQVTVDGDSLRLA